MPHFLLLNQTFHGAKSQPTLIALVGQQASRKTRSRRRQQAGLHCNFKVSVISDEMAAALDLQAKANRAAARQAGHTAPLAGRRPFRDDRTRTWFFFFAREVTADGCVHLFCLHAPQHVRSCVCVFLPKVSCGIPSCATLNKHLFKAAPKSSTLVSVASKRVSVRSDKSPR